MRRKMLKVRMKRALAGILCVSLLVSEVVFIDFRSYAAEVKPVVENGFAEETGKEDGGQGGLSEGNVDADDKADSSEEGNEAGAGADTAEEGGDDEKVSSDGNGATESESGSTEGNKGMDSPEIEGNTDGELGFADNSGGKQEGESAPGGNENVEGGNGEGTDAKIDTEEDVGDLAEETVSEKCGDNLTWTLEDGTLTISGTGEMYHDYWGGSNKAPWMPYSDSIHRLVIEPGVTDIGQYAFYKCSNLKTLSIPDSVTSIAESAFGYCSNLKTLSIPDSVTYIGRFAFEYCSSLSSVVIPDGVEKIYDAAFSHCDNLKKVTLPASVTTLGLSVFSGCTSLSGAGPIGGGYDFEFGWIDAIPSNAFYGSKLKCILIPNGITKIGTDAFAYCENLEKVVIPASVNMLGNHVYDDHNQLITAGPIGGGYNIEFGWTDAIPDHAFDHCSKLKEIQISGNISSIGAYAFNLCNSLENLIIPDSVREIGDDAFNNCNAILELTIPNNVYKIGGSAFSQCDSLSKMIIPNNVTQIGLDIFYGCDNLEHVSLSNQLTSIQGTFAKCTNLSSVSIPSSVKKIGYMTFYDCSKLSDIYYSGSEAQWKGIEFSSDCKTALSNVAIHYNSEWGIIKDPTDIIQNDITVNGKGYAYANFTLKNNTGEIQRNARITYTVGGRSHEAVSDEKGHIALKSPLLENTTGKNEKRTIIVQDMTLHYASGKTEMLGYKVTMDVTVSPLSFTQKWELGVEGSITGGVSGGAGVTVGVAQVETSLAKAEISGTAGGTLSVEHSFEDGTRSLTLFQNYESKLAARAKVGPAAKAGVLGQDLDIGIVTAGGGVVAGKSVGIGLKLDHYDPNNMGQIADIGTFMLGSQAQAGGDMMMLQLAERAGFDFWNLERYGGKVSAEDGADVGSIKFGDAAEGKLASLSAEQTISYDMQRDKTDASKELTFGYELGAAVSAGETSIAHMEETIFSKSDSNKLEISAGIDGNNRIENFTVKKEEKSADGFLHEKGIVETAAVIYDREGVEQLKENIGMIGEFLSGSTKYILGDAQQELFKQLDNTPVRGSYSTTVAEQTKQDVKLAFGFEMGFELGASIGYEGASSCEYETAGGIYEKGKRYITNTNEIEAEVKENSYSIEQIVSEPIKAIGERLKKFLEDNYDKLKNGVQNGGAVIEQGILGPISQWVVHIVSLKEEKTRASTFQSYEIMAYDTEEIFGQEMDGSIDANVNEYKAYTIGNPYYVYVTDETENEIMDYSDNPLILRLSYTDEMLADADLTEIEVHNLAIYMYSQEFCGYMCVGGAVDTEAKAVSVEITKPGQYILAVDSASPTVKNITVSRDTNKPLITVEFNETSGFQMFSMKLDGEEVIGTADWNKYYNKVYNSFSYQVEKELTDGKHICAVYAVDTAGNAMTVPYEKEFYIGQDPIESIILDKNKLALSVGETATLKAEITPDTVAGTLVIWESSDTSVATVEKGIVTAISVGECMITVSVGDRSATCDIEVIFGQAGEVIASGSYENVSWQIDASGKLTVEGSGDFANSNAVNRVPWFDYRSVIKSAEINLAGTTNASYMFNGCQNLIDIDVSNWDINKVTDMTGLFRDCGGLTSLNLSNLDVEKVINFTGFFEGCYKLSTIYAPCNLKMSVQLPKGNSTISGNSTLFEDIWYDIDGNTYTELPQNLSRSIVLTKGQKPAISEPYITLEKEKTSYVIGEKLNIDDLKVTYYNETGIPSRVNDYTTNANEINMSTLGAKTLVVTYRDLSAEIKITVSEKLTEETPETKGLKITFKNDQDRKSIYIGSAIKPEIIVSYNGRPLVEGTNYTVKYANNVKVGYAKIMVMGKGNFKSSKTENFKIVQADIADAELGGTDREGRLVVVSGSKFAPAIYYGNLKLTKKDYSIGGTVVAGKKITDGDSNKTVTIKGTGNYTGNKEIILRVVKKSDLKKFTVTLDKTKLNALTYDGRKHYIHSIQGALTVTGKDGNTNMKRGADYRIVYPANVTDAGTKKFSVIGMGLYTGTVSKSYTIKPVTVTNGTIKAAYERGNIENIKLPYRSTGVTFNDQLRVTYTKNGNTLTLREGKDYKVTYSGNRKVGGNAKFTISFLGNYRGLQKQTRTFTVEKADLKDATVIIADAVYKKKPGIYKSVPYVIEQETGRLIKASNYTVTYYTDPARNMEMKGQNKVASGDTVYVKLEAKANGNYKSDKPLVKTYQVANAIDLSKAKISFMSAETGTATKLAEYTGQKITDREIKVLVNGKPADVDMIVTYANNVDKGKATVIITGTGRAGCRYIGCKKATFTISAYSFR